MDRDLGSSRILLAATLALLITGNAAIDTARACQCGTILSPEAAFDRAALVFTGVVTSIWLTQCEIEPGGSLGRIPIRHVKFKVGRVFKGPAWKEFTLIMAGSNCDYGFSEAGAYLVYAELGTDYDGTITASICRPTKRLREATDEIKLLEQKAKTLSECGQRP